MIGCIKSAILITVVIFLAACGTGPEFKRPEPESLILGQTTFEEILQRFGKFDDSAVENIDGKMTKSIFYTNANTYATPAFSSVIPTRCLSFHFIDDILVGHIFNSSYKVDSTYFEPTKVKQIKKGITTRSQVIDLFGNKYGACLFPQFSYIKRSIEKEFKNEEGKGIWYSYFQTKQSGHMTLDGYGYEIIVSFNKDDIVSNIYFRSSGKM
jgi:hypothetical protein